MFPFSETKKTTIAWIIFHNAAQSNKLLIPQEVMFTIQIWNKIISYNILSCNIYDYLCLD